MKFNLSDFLQLDTKGLLAVNGGFNCNGSTNNTVYPNTYYSGNGESPNGGGGNDHNGKNWYSKGDIVDSIPRGGTFIKSDGKSFTYSFGSGKSKNTTTFQKNPDGTYLVTYSHYDGPVSSNGSKNSGGSSGGGSCSTPTTGSNNSNGQGYSQTSSNPGKNSDDKGKKDNTPQGGGTCPGKDGGTHIPPSDDGSGTGDGGTDIPNGGGICGGTGGSGEEEITNSEKNNFIQESLFRSIKKLGFHTYDIADEEAPDVEYRCDEYIADILERSGFSIVDYCLDDPVGKSVDTHYQDMKAKNLTLISKESELEECASYIVVMRDADHNIDSHIGLYINGGEKGFCFVDNSQSNYGGLGGSEIHKGNSFSEVFSDYHNYEHIEFLKIQ